MKIQKQFWIFSNKPSGHYGDDFWDMEAILNKKRYSFRKSERNLKHIQKGDHVYIRIFGDSLIGHFVIGGPWKQLQPKNQRNQENDFGTFPMIKLNIWNTKLQFDLIQPELSNQDQRSRILRLREDDSIKIETARNILHKLKLGVGDEETIILLENGIEEAVKVNLSLLNLKLADDKISQQFIMGIGVGRSDLICIDQNGDYVVLEIKKDSASREAIGQVMTYVGWVQENLALKGQKVLAAIVASYFDQDIRYAAKASGIRLIRVRI